MSSEKVDLSFLLASNVLLPKFRIQIHCREIIMREVMKPRITEGNANPQPFSSEAAFSNAEVILYFPEALRSAHQYMKLEANTQLLISLRMSVNIYNPRRWQLIEAKSRSWWRLPRSWLSSNPALHDAGQCLCLQVVPDS